MKPLQGHALPSFETPMGEWLKIATQAAHDIRAPILALETAIRKEQIDSDDRNLITLATQRIKALALEILDVSKTPNHLTKPTCNLGATVEGVVKELKAQLGDKITITINNQTRDASIPLSEFELYRMITNLIMNAADAFSAQGQISISCYLDSHHAHLRVKDNGCGIPEALLRSLNEQAVSTKPNGHGIGLSSARQLVEGCGGKLLIHSKVGFGTIVTASFPLINN